MALTAGPIATPKIVLAFGHRRSKQVQNFILLRQVQGGRVPQGATGVHDALQGRQAQWRQACRGRWCAAKRCGRQVRNQAGHGGWGGVTAQRRHSQTGCARCKSESLQKAVLHRPIPPCCGRGLQCPHGWEGGAFKGKPQRNSTARKGVGRKFTPDSWTNLMLRGSNGRSMSAAGSHLAVWPTGPAQGPSPRRCNLGNLLHALHPQAVPTCWMTSNVLSAAEALAAWQGLGVWCEIPRHMWVQHERESLTCDTHHVFAPACAWC